MSEDGPAAGISSWDDAPPLPTELQVEVTGSCNLRCAMCLVAYRPTLNRLEGSMPFETFKRVVDDLPELELVTLQGLGEPLLAPDLFRMVEYAASRGIRMGFNTNATLLTRDKAVRLVKSGLEWLHISVDGATKEVYESIRAGSSFERVERNVRGLVQVMKERSAARPTLSMVFVAMKRNIHELPDMVRLAADWGLARLWVQNLSHSFSDVDPVADYRQIREYAEREALWTGPDPRTEELFRDARRVGKELGVRVRLPKLAGRQMKRRPGAPGCDWPWRSAYVTHRGAVQPCCMLMGADRGVLGSVEKNGFREVWTSEEYRRFRGELMSEKPPDVCRGCSMYRGVF